MPAPSEQVQDHLWQQAQASPGGRLYVVLDGARDKRIHPNVLLSGARYACLYRGRLPEVLEKAAPYLVELQPNAAFTNWLIKYGWGNSWGTFLSASASLDTVQRHLRRFLKVRSPRGRRLYFRYYDPRVLRIYLPTCTRQDLDAFFGPILGFHAEDEDGAMQDYTRRAYGLSEPAEAVRAQRHGLLTFRDEQMSQMREALVASFIREAEAYLWARFPEQCQTKSPEQLRSLIEQGRQRSITYGIMKRNDVFRFLGYMVDLGPNFDQQRETGWAAEFLGQLSKTATERLDALDAYIRQRRLEEQLP